MAGRLVLQRDGPAVGKTFFPPLAAYTLSTFCHRESGQQGECLLVVLRLISLCPEAKSYSIFSNRLLPCGYHGYPQAMAMTCVTSESTGTCPYQ